MNHIHKINLNLLLLAFIFSCNVFAQQYLDLSKTLFGIEYSFQDEIIVKEPGRSTMTTPYKEQKLVEMIRNYIFVRNLPESSIEYKRSWKPGYYINVPDDGRYVINTEPVTIEFNTTPKKLSEILDAAKPIYKAAEMSQLKPYVNPAAERSGMGHIHVGGTTLSESPFYLHENLLRNVIAFFHKHPSLLFGFAEAYDIGRGSNIETLHDQDKQAALAEIFKEYDTWSKQPKDLKHTNGLIKLIEQFISSNHNVRWTSYGQGFDGWFAHYRFINLEHLLSIDLYNFDPNDTGKKTVEFRMFRPPPTAEHAEAMAKLLVLIMDYLAKPNYLEKFKTFTKSEFNTFMTATAIESDWLKVKKLVGIKDPLLDSMINELTSAIRLKKIKDEPKIGLEIFESYSEKEYKGTRFEIRLNRRIWESAPLWLLGEKVVNFYEFNIGKEKYWVGHVSPFDSGIDVATFKKYPVSQIKYYKPGSCRFLFKNAG